MEKQYFVRSILNTFVSVDYKSFKFFMETFELLHPDYVMTSNVIELASHRFECKHYSCNDGEFAYIMTDLDFVPFS